VSTHTPPVRRRLAAAVCAPVLLVSFAACGSDDSAGDSAAPSGLSSGDTVPTDDFADTIKAALEDATTAHMTTDTDLGGMGSMKAEGDVDYTTTPVSLSMTMTTSGGGSGDEQIEMILVDNTMYMKSPDGLGAGDKYLALDLGDADSLVPGMGDLVDQMDPMSSMQEFGDALDEVTYEGTEDVDGESLAKYDVTVTTSGLSQFSDLSKQMDLPETVDYEIYLDSDGLMRRMETAFEVMSQKMEVVVTLDDWGKDVTITAPPKSETTSFSDMLGG
jgi:hypothetical protein